MEFNKEKFLQKYNDMRRQAKGLSPFEIVDLTDKVGISHNHNRLLVDFSQTQMFQNHLNKSELIKRDWYESRVEWEKIKTQLLEHEKGIHLLPFNKLSFSHLSPYLNLLSDHLIIPGYPNFLFRWSPCNGLLSDLPEKVEYIFDTLNDLISTPLYQRTKVYSKYKSWNYILNGLWGMVNLGLWEEALYCIGVLEKLLLDLRTNIDSPHHILYPEVRKQPTRFFMSLYMVKGKILIANNKTQEAINNYQDIVNFQYPDPIKNQIYGYPGITRVFEASIEVYKLSPTKENKNQMLNLLLNVITSTPVREPTESIRERCLTIFMLAKVLFPDNIK